MKTKFFTIVSVMMLVLVSGAMACHEQIVVKDDQGTPMGGVLVELSSECHMQNGVYVSGEGYSVTDTTAANGFSFDWSVTRNCLYNATVIGGAEGYVCTQNDHYNQGERNDIHLTCTPAEDVPEFGILAAFGVLALAGLFIYKKRE